MHDIRSETSLTPRQREVLERIVQRQTLKEIASDLGLSESAINQHVRELKRKLQVNSLSELARSVRDAPALLENTTGHLEQCGFRLALAA